MRGAADIGFPLFKGYNFNLVLCERQVSYICLLLKFQAKHMLYYTLLSQQPCDRLCKNFTKEHIAELFSPMLVYHAYILATYEVFPLFNIVLINAFLHYF